MSKIQLIKQQQLEADKSGIPTEAAESTTQLRKIQAAKAQELTEGKQYEPSEAPSASAAEVHGDLAHYQAAMDADLASLATLKTLEEKIAAKKQMILTYWGFVTQYMDQGHAYPNSIAVRVMIWLFDVFDIERGLQLAYHLVKQGIHVTPPKFDRDIPTFVCDAIYDWASALLKLEQSASPYLDDLVATIDNEQWSLSPPVHSKMYAMLAKHKNREGDYATCAALCEQAEKVNPEGAGVQTLKKGAMAKLKAEAEKTE